MQLVVRRLQCDFRFLAFSDVDGTTDVTKKRSIRGKAWSAGVVYPTIFTIASTQPVFHAKRLSFVKTGGIRFEAALVPYQRAAALGAPAEVYRQLAAVYAKLGRSADRDKALAAYEQRRNSLETVK